MPHRWRDTTVIAAGPMNRMKPADSAAAGLPSRRAADSGVTVVVFALVSAATLAPGLSKAKSLIRVAGSRIAATGLLMLGCFLSGLL